MCAQDGALTGVAARVRENGCANACTHALVAACTWPSVRVPGHPLTHTRSASAHTRTSTLACTLACAHNHGSANDSRASAGAHASAMRCVCACAVHAHRNTNERSPTHPRGMYCHVRVQATVGQQWSAVPVPALTSTCVPGREIASTWAHARFRVSATYAPTPAHWHVWRWRRVRCACGVCGSGRGQVRARQSSPDCGAQNTHAGRVEGGGRDVLKSL